MAVTLYDFATDSVLHPEGVKWAVWITDNLVYTHLISILHNRAHTDHTKHT